MRSISARSRRATAALLGLLVACGVSTRASADGVTVTIDEPAAEAYVPREFVVTGSAVDSTGAATVVRVNGVAAEQDGGRFRASVRAERDGILRLRVVAALPGAPATVVERPVRVDGTPPVLSVEASPRSDLRSGEVTLDGEVRDVSPVTLRVNDHAVKVESDGSFELTYVLPEQGDLVLDFVAVDAAGNRASLRHVLRTGATAPAAQPSAAGASARPDAPTGVRPGPAQDAVARALTWLAAHASGDGGWESEGFRRWCDGTKRLDEGPDGAGKAQYDVGVTGLALLAFLRAGYDHRSPAPFGPTVAAGLKFLRSVQDAQGCVGSRTHGHYVYNHAIAARALVEACVRSPSEPLRVAAQKAVDFILASRNPQGGWRYGVQPGDSDTSVTGWMAGVLFAARGPHPQWPTSLPPLASDDTALRAARDWVGKMTDPETGRVGYQQRGTGPARPTELVDKFPAAKSESMTAVALVVRLTAGESPNASEPLRRGIALLLEHPPVWETDRGSIDLYYWYCATEAMALVGGEARSRWNAALSAALLGAQRRDTTPCLYAGSWDPVDPWGPDGGRVYATAIAALSLLASVQDASAAATAAAPATAPPAATAVAPSEAEAALRRRAHEFARAWAGLLARCPKCSGDGRWFGTKCPQCGGGGRVYDRSVFLKAFEFMVSPLARARPRFKEDLERAWASVQRGESPVLVFRDYAVEGVTLLDATHGVVTIRDRQRDVTEATQWILMPDSSGRPTWWRFTEGADGTWPSR